MRRRGMGFDIILKSVQAEGLVWKTKFCSGQLRFVYTSYLWFCSTCDKADSSYNRASIETEVYCSISGGVRQFRQPLFHIFIILKYILLNRILKNQKVSLKIPLQNGNESTILTVGLGNQNSYIYTNITFFLGL